MSEPTIYEAALGYVRKGFSIIPCAGKTASIPWAALQKRRPTEDDVNAWHASGILKNVAVICGAVSGDLVVIDLDGDKAVNAFAARWPALMETYTVVSGSGHGAHVYLRCANLPRTTRGMGLDVGNIELRANGCYVIAPPSVHPISGQPYKVHSRTPIQRVDDLRMLTEWIRGLGKSDCPQPLPRYEVKSPSGWARAALSAECAAVRTAPSGQRNATLNRAAFKMGQLVADHKLSLSEVEQQLKAAADALVGADGENTVIRTIRSGLEAGLNNPRGI